MAETNNVVTLGHTNLKINKIGFGCMGLSDFYGTKDNRPTDEHAVKLIHRCIEIGINFFDTAYVYAWGVNEELLGKAIREGIAAGKFKREDVVIATKYGLVKTEQGMSVSSSPENVKAVIDGSLKRLDIGYIDLVYQHRVDPKTPIEDTIRAAAEYVKEGKVKALGLSEAGVATIRRAHAVHPISALQTEYSLWTPDPETNGLLDVCHELGITFVAYSPLGRGFLTGAITKPEDLDEKDWRRNNPRFMGENFTKNLDLVKAIQNIAKHKGCNPSQLALAWVLRKPGVVAIPGSTKIQNMEDNVGAYKITLTDEDNAAIKKILDQFVVSGSRYDESSMTLLSL
jgi:aryl-alcohol dehydrogenase-like predicted oxidoreductase